ncbi:MerR family transcriptional regulator [Alcanivorax borkumensis]|jgi:DNA-binding transcriptional MerR regulator|uniref:MerR family transcriptional regulator n=1 Tax=Alcanivorax borkumensis TaxID=59754 RepID=UPI001ABF3D4E
MRVSELAKQAKTTAETVRHYTNIGLLSPSRDSHNGYRYYRAEDLRLLRFALKARSLGFTLSDIQSLIHASREGETPCGQVRTLIEDRLNQVETRITELQALSDRMRDAMEQWQGAPDCRLDDGRVCGLIDSFVGDEDSEPSPASPDSN